MNYEEALEYLGITDYAERIFNSSSRGELMHLQDYIIIAESIDNSLGWFIGWFKLLVQYAENNMERPESVFQHIYVIFFTQFNKIK